MQPRSRILERLLEAYAVLARASSLALWQRLLLALIHGTIALVRALNKDRIHVRAATLGYWSLVAIVPVLLLAFSLMGPLGMLDSAAVRVREALYASIFAGSISDVAEYLDGLVKNVKLETLGVAGFLGVLLAGSKMYFSAEQAYNDMFGVRVRRGWLLRITLFYALVTLTPLLLSLGFVATSAMGKSLPSGLLGRAVPVALTTVAFVMAIKLLPQLQVKWRAALAGGLTSAILFEAAKTGFTAYTTLLGANSAQARIYGSLGLLPVFLLYLYLLWLIVLLGVELAFVVQYADDLLPREKARLLQPDSWGRAPDALFALQVLVTMTRRYQDGRGPATTAWVARCLETSNQAVRDALTILETAHMVARLDEDGFLPARPMESLTASVVITECRRMSVPSSSPEGPGANAIEQVLALLATHMHESIADLARDTKGLVAEPTAELLRDRVD